MPTKTGSPPIIFGGRNGRGKTTFLRRLMDTNEEVRKYEYGGSITAAVRFEYFPYHVERPETMALDMAEEILPGCPLPALLHPEPWRTDQGPAGALVS